MSRGLSQRQERIRELLQSAGEPLSTSDIAHALIDMGEFGAQSPRQRASQKPVGDEERDALTRVVWRALKSLDERGFVVKAYRSAASSGGNPAVSAVWHLADAPTGVGSK